MMLALLRLIAKCHLISRLMPSTLPTSSHRCVLGASPMDPRDLGGRGATATTGFENGFSIFGYACAEIFFYMIGMIPTIMQPQPFLIAWLS